jgi:class 3 adenylate cyclase
MPPETKYAKSGDVHIAYQVIGNGPIDLVHTLGAASNIEYLWEEPSCVRYFQRLASFSRLILFDKRGSGLSDRVIGVPTLEERMDDLRAAMDAIGSERAVLIGASEAGAMSVLFAATYPERVTALILYAALASWVWAEDYPWRPTREAHLQQLAQATPMQLFNALSDNWAAPSRASDEHFKHWFATYIRQSVSPSGSLALRRMNVEIDVRHVLPAIRVPTLVLHRTNDSSVNVEEGRYLAQHISGAKFVELPGIDHWPTVGDSDSILNEIEEFVTGARPAPEPDRVLATVMFTDIVNSTQRATELGDRRWHDVIENHNTILQREIARFRGRVVHSTGDGVLATFDGPARAVRCACAISDAVKSLGIEIRAGLHTGEIELLSDDVAGIAVHIGARVSALAGASEVLVSSTVKDLVAGSGLRFAERGAHSLKGVSGEWRLFNVMRGA